MVYLIFSKIKTLLVKDRIFLLCIFATVAWLFKSAFSLNFFNDDFYLLKISHPKSILELLGFFSLAKPYGFYRPVSIEIFYSLINLAGGSPLVGYIISFSTYFIGLTFLYFSLIAIFPTKKLIARVGTFIYAIHFTHVYQLLWLAAYQEIALFTFLSASFYFAIKRSTKLYFLCLVLALMSREQAVFFPMFLTIFFYFQKRIETTRFIIVGSLFLSATFFVIYLINYQAIATRQEYAFDPNLSLIMNNIFWYSAWTIGLPSILPDYFPSVFGPPIKEFNRYLADKSFVTYLVGLGVYLFGLGTYVFTSLKHATYRRNLIRVFLLVSVGVLIFILPALPIIHRWMLRLTVPLVFVVVFQAWIIDGLNKNHRFVAKGLLATFFIWNLLAIGFHEVSSSYLLESKISGRVQKILLTNRSQVIESGNIFFYEEMKSNSGWSGSKKIKLTLSNQSFLNYYLPDEKLIASYSFETVNKPIKSFVINSDELIR